MRKRISETNILLGGKPVSVEVHWVLWPGDDNIYQPETPYAEVVDVLRNGTSLINLLTTYEIEEIEKMLEEAYREDDG